SPVLVRSRHRSDDEIIVSKAMVERCFSMRVALLATDAAECRKKIEPGNEVEEERTCCVICAPLVAAGRVLGVVYLDLQRYSGHERGSFTKDDLDLVAGIALQAAMAIQNARLH